MKRLIRALKSLYDGVVFFEIKLSANPGLFKIVLFAVPALGLLDIVLSQLPLNPLHLLPLHLAVASVVLTSLAKPLKMLYSYLSPRRSQRYRIEPNEVMKGKAEQFQPSGRDQKYGYRNVPPKKGFAGGVHVSEDFNVQCMANTNWDVDLVTIDPDSDPYPKILREIRNHRVAFRQHGWKTIREKLLGPLPLINESKIGIASDFHVNMKKLSVYKSSYLATWCSGDLAFSDIWEVTDNDSNDVVVSDAEDRIPFESNNKVDELQSLSDTSQTISAQFGINFIGITADNYLLVALQSEHNLQGAGKRVPLASGSMDWADRSETKTLKELGEIAANRELREEWGGIDAKADDKLLKITKFLPVGIFRVPDRSGKPEFAALGRINWSYANLVANPAEVRKVAVSKSVKSSHASLKYKVSDIYQFKLAIADLINTPAGAPNTTPLYGVLVCIQDLLNACPNKISNLLNQNRGARQVSGP